MSLFGKGKKEEELTEELTEAVTEAVTEEAPEVPSGKAAWEEALGAESLYFVNSPLTRLPFLEQMGEENRVYVFTDLEAARTCVKVLDLGHNPAGITRFTPDLAAGLLLAFRKMGADTIALDLDGNRTTVPLFDVVEEKKEEPGRNTLPENPDFVRAMAYFMQVFRAKDGKTDEEELKRLDREMVQQMLVAKYLMAVREIEKDGKKFPGILIMEHKENGSAVAPLFTDLSEFLRFRKENKELKVMPTNFGHLTSLNLPAGKAITFLVNPATIAVPLPQDYMRKVMNDLKAKAEAQKQENNTEV